MAQIRMTHPEHGYHVVYDGADEKKLTEAGWKRITEAAFREIVAAKSQRLEVEAEEVVEAPKKRGPKPKA